MSRATSQKGGGGETCRHPFTEAESVFLARMAPHFAAGLSIEESAAAVIADDERLFCALHDRDTGPAIREALARDVYTGIRGKA